MEKLFAELTRVLAEHQKILTSAESADVPILLSEFGEKLQEIITAYSAVVEEALIENIDADLSEIEVDTATVYAPNLALLTQAAVLTLAHRGDIVAQLAEKGNIEHATEVQAFLNTIGDTVGDVKVTESSTTTSEGTTTFSSSSSTQNINLSGEEAESLIGDVNNLLNR